MRPLLVALSVLAAGCYQTNQSAEDAGAPDAGVDASAPPVEVDAGAPDAAPPRTRCSPPGECDLFTGAGCPEGTFCQAGSNGAWYETACVYGPAEGGEGSACEDFRSCGAGLFCHPEGACREWCCLDGEDTCPAGQACRPVDRDTGLGLCTAGEDCDPVDDTGCRPGTSCYWVLDRLSCHRSGSTPVGEPCSALIECVPGALCVPTSEGARCRPMCRLDEGGCGEGEACRELAPSAPWGACVIE